MTKAGFIVTAGSTPQTILKEAKNQLILEISNKPSKDYASRGTHAGRISRLKNLIRTARENIRAQKTNQRKCKVCLEVKPLSAFTAYRRNNAGLVYYYDCSQCRTNRSREYNLKRLFDLSLDDYELLLEVQDGRCAVCLRLPNKNRLAVDHDHKTGRVRGLLCYPCNRLLGWGNDDPVRFLRAGRYLTIPPASLILNREVFGKIGATEKRRRKRRK